MSIYPTSEEIEKLHWKWKAYRVPCDERTKITNNISDHPLSFLDSQLTLLLRMALRRHGKARLYFKTPACSIRPKFKTNFRSNFYTLPPQLNCAMMQRRKKDCRNRESVRGLKFGVALGQRFENWNGMRKWNFRADIGRQEANVCCALKGISLRRITSFSNNRKK